MSLSVSVRVFLDLKPAIVPGVVGVWSPWVPGVLDQGPQVGWFFDFWEPFHRVTMTWI